MDSFNENVEKDALHDWIESETRALDLVASWESLCETYRALEFADPISDTARMEEFKWIIKEMNKHLTRARKQLLTCKDVNSVQEVLSKMFTSAGATSIASRTELVYHKLRQRWVLQMLAQLTMIEEEVNGEPSE